MKKSIFIVIMVLVAGYLVFGSLTLKPALAAGKITLNLVGYVPKMNLSYRGWVPLFVDKINKRSKGELIINPRGGPEVIAPFDLGKAVSKGTIDMAFVPSGFYSGVVPGADTNRLSPLTVEEERARGMYKHMRDIHAKAGIYYVGRQQPIRGHYFFVCLRKPVKRSADFKGLKIGGSPSFLAHFKALGATPVKAALKEYYPSVERGVFDGNIVGLNVYVGTGEFEVAPYVIDHFFYKATPTVLMNLKKWNSLPDNMKKLVTEVQLETENACLDVFDDETAMLRKKAAKGGAKFLKLPPDVAKWYVDTAYSAGWADDAKKYPASSVQKFKEIFGQ